MTFLLTILSTFNTLSNYWTHARTTTMSWIRRYLGPEPQNWILLTDGRILPSTTILPPAVQETSYLYDIQTNHLTKMDGAIPGRHRHLPILALQIQNPDVGSIDISDWVGEIRMFPLRDIVPRQLIELWGAVHNRYVPILETTANVTRNDGSVETVNVL